MSLALAAVILAAAPIVVDAPCDAPIGGAVSRLGGAGGEVRLAPGCTYKTELRLSGQQPLTLVGRAGTRIVGRIVADGAGPVTLRNLTLEGPLTPIVARNTLALELEGVVIRSGDDAMHVYGGGAVNLRDCEIGAAATGIWVTEAQGFRMVGGRIRATDQAVVVRGVAGEVHVTRSHIEVGPTTAPASINVEGPERVELVGNVFVHLQAPGPQAGAVLDLDVSGGLVADNDFRTGVLSVRSWRKLSVGCNRFRTLMHTVKGPVERVCASDLAPNTLDWRARLGGPDAEACRIAPGGVCETAASMPTASLPTASLR